MPGKLDFSQDYVDEVVVVFNKLKMVREEDFVKLKESIDTNNTLNRCWSVMQSLRNNALCLRCSGNALNYYDVFQQRYTLSDAHCDNLIEKCSQIWSLMANVTWTSDLLYRLKKYSNKRYDTRLTLTTLSA